VLYVPFELFLIKRFLFLILLQYLFYVMASSWWSLFWLSVWFCLCWGMKVLELKLELILRRSLLTRGFLIFFNYFLFYHFCMLRKQLVLWFSRSLATTFTFVIAFFKYTKTIILIFSSGNISQLFRIKFVFIFLSHHDVLYLFLQLMFET